MKLEDLFVKENTAEANMLGNWPTDTPWLMKFPGRNLQEGKQKI